MEKERVRIVSAPYNTPQCVVYQLFRPHESKNNVYQGNKTKNTYLCQHVHITTVSIPDASVRLTILYKLILLYLKEKKKKTIIVVAVALRGRAQYKGTISCSRERARARARIDTRGGCYRDMCSITRRADVNWKSVRGRGRERESSLDRRYTLYSHYHSTMKYIIFSIKCFHSTLLFCSLFFDTFLSS